MLRILLIYTLLATDPKFTGVHLDEFYLGNGIMDYVSEKLQMFNFMENGQRWTIMELVEYFQCFKRFIVFVSVTVNFHTQIRHLRIRLLHHNPRHLFANLPNPPSSPSPHPSSPLPPRNRKPCA